MTSLFCFVCRLLPWLVASSGALAARVPQAGDMLSCARKLSLCVRACRLLRWHFSCVYGLGGGWFICVATALFAVRFGHTEHTVCQQIR